jgi:hypothetical protein
VKKTTSTTRPTGGKSDLVSRLIVTLTEEGPLKYRLLIIERPTAPENPSTDEKEQSQ